MTILAHALGVAIVVLVFAFIFILSAIKTGWRTTLEAFGFAIGITILVGIAAYLVTL